MESQSAGEPSYLAGLSEPQHQAVTHHGHCLIVACPGSGKTRVLTCRAAHLVASSPTARVIAVTFTKDAADELGKRVRPYIAQKDRKRVITGTFHSLALKQLREANRQFRILTGHDQKSLIFRAMNSVPEDIELDTAVHYIEAMKSTLHPRAVNAQQAKIFEQYQSMLQRHEAHDFQDLMLSVVKGMHDGSIAPFSVTDILADEFQDADEIQLEWIKLHARAGAKVTVVGDDDQSLYGWRHAMGYSGMRSFKDNHFAREIHLSTNYRSCREILELGGRLIHNNADRINKSLRTHQGPGAIISLVRLNSREEEAYTMACDVESSPADWAVIARTNAILNHAQAALEVQHIPYFRSGGNLWSSRAPATFKGLLKSIVTGDSLGAENALLFAKLDPEVLQSAHEQGIFAPQESPPPKTQNRMLDAFLDKLTRWRQNAQRGHHDLVIAAVASWMRPYTFGKMNNINLDLAMLVLERLKGSIEDRIKVIDRPRKKDEQDAQGVTLLTMHASKGLEFPSVWIVGMEADVCPHAENHNLQEERRLFYVGITRAKQRLVISSALQAGKPSPFLIESGLLPPNAAAA